MGPDGDQNATNEPDLAEVLEIQGEPADSRAYVAFDDEEGEEDDPLSSADYILDIMDIQQEPSKSVNVVHKVQSVY